MEVIENIKSMMEIAKQFGIPTSYILIGILIIVLFYGLYQYHKFLMTTMKQEKGDHYTFNAPVYNVSGNNNHFKIVIPPDQQSAGKKIKKNKLAVNYSRAKQSKKLNNGSTNRNSGK